MLVVVPRLADRRPLPLSVSRRCRLWSGLVWSRLVSSGLVSSGLVWPGLPAAFCPQFGWSVQPGCGRNVQGLGPAPNMQPRSAARQRREPLEVGPQLGWVAARRRVKAPCCVAASGPTAPNEALVAMTAPQGSDRSTRFQLPHGPPAVRLDRPARLRTVRRPDGRLGLIELVAIDRSAARLGDRTVTTGCGAAWLARLSGGQEAGSSNLPSPTNENGTKPQVRDLGLLRYPGSRVGSKPRCMRNV